MIFEHYIVSSIKSANKVKLVLFFKYFFEKEIDIFYSFPSIEKDQNVINERKDHGLQYNNNDFLWLWTFFNKNDNNFIV